MSVEPGWYPDPDGSPALRWWDGERWTGELHDVERAVADDAAPRLDSPLPQAGPTPAAASPRSTVGRWRLIVVLLAIASVAVWGFVGYQALDDPSDQATVTTTGGSGAAIDDEIEADDAADVAEDGDGFSEGDDGMMDVIDDDTGADEEDEGTDAAAGDLTPGDGERVATLIVGVAKLREEPELAARELATIEDRAGAELVVIGEPVDGWYRIRLDELEGWLFGAFVLPPADGLTVVRTLDEEMVVLRDRNGVVLDRDNRSGSFALVVDASDPWWRVVLPEGGFAFIDPDEVAEVRP